MINDIHELKILFDNESVFRTVNLIFFTALHESENLDFGLSSQTYKLHLIIKKWIMTYITMRSHEWLMMLQHLVFLLKSYLHEAFRRQIIECMKMWFFKIHMKLTSNKMIRNNMISIITDENMTNGDAKKDDMKVWCKLSDDDVW